MSDAATSRLCRELTVLAHAGIEWPALARRASLAVQRYVPFDKACWHTIDPETHLLTGALKEGIDRDEPRLPRYEASVDDVNQFRFLARCAPPVGILSRATHGDLDRSPRFRDLLRALGIAWEIRCVFVVDGTPWGACSLYRSPGKLDFTQRDADTLAAVSRPLAEAFRRALVLHGQALSDAPDGPGLILLDDDDQTVSITPAATRWLGELVDIGVTGERRLPAPVYAVAARARTLTPGSSEAGIQARARAFTTSGGWLLLYGARLTGDRQSLTSVIIEPAKAADVILLILDAYGLSDRECQITQLIFAGRSTNEIATELHLAPLTVQHYLKTVFEKTGVHSRRELVARLAGAGDVVVAAG